MSQVAKSFIWIGNLAADLFTQLSQQLGGERQAVWHGGNLCLPVSRPCSAESKKRLKQRERFNGKKKGGKLLRTVVLILSTTDDIWGFSAVFSIFVIHILVYPSTKDSGQGTMVLFSPPPILFSQQACEIQKSGSDSAQITQCIIAEQGHINFMPPGQRPTIILLNILIYQPGMFLVPTMHLVPYLG